MAWLEAGTGQIATTRLALLIAIVCAAAVLAYVISKALDLPYTS